MRLNLKHWLVVMTITEGAAIGIFYPNLLPDAKYEAFVGTLKILLVVVPIIVSLVMCLVDLAEQDAARYRQRQLDKRNQLLATAKAKIPQEDGRVVAFYDDRAIIFPAVKWPLRCGTVISYENIRWFVKTMDELGIETGTKENETDPITYRGRAI